MQLSKKLTNEQNYLHDSDRKLNELCNVYLQRTCQCLPNFKTGFRRFRWLRKQGRIEVSHALKNILKANGLITFAWKIKSSGMLSSHSWWHCWKGIWKRFWAVYYLTFSSHSIGRKLKYFNAFDIAWISKVYYVAFISLIRDFVFPTPKHLSPELPVTRI